MPFRVVEVQPTPNPNAAKFILDREVSSQPISFFSAESAKNHALAKRLFAIEGISSLLFLGDFITINKNADSDWKKITSLARKVIETDV